MERKRTYIEQLLGYWNKKLSLEGLWTNCIYHLSLEIRIAKSMSVVNSLVSSTTTRVCEIEATYWRILTVHFLASFGKGGGWATWKSTNGAALENISSDETKSSGIQVILKECGGPPAQTVTVGESRVGNVKEQRKEGGWFTNGGYCTITTLGSQGVTRNGRERYQTQIFIFKKLSNFSSC
jgi:hypothetical protein